MSEWYVQKKKPLKFDVDTMHLFKNKKTSENMAFILF